jgi:hypothetical protein
MQPKTVKQIFAGLSFFVALIVYSLTVAPTVSFWDCGEFIAAAYTQGVPHPPGAPLYLLVARIFTFIPEFLIADVALRVNIISVLSSAVTVLLTFLIIVRFLDWMNPDSETEENGKLFNYIGAFIGALVFAFSDSFWFNAVEAEVYAPSMFLRQLSPGWSSVGESIMIDPAMSATSSLSLTSSVWLLVCICSMFWPFPSSFISFTFAKSAIPSAIYSLLLWLALSLPVWSSW